MDTRKDRFQMTETVYRTMADVRQANKDAGYHWFDSSTLGFFGSVIGRTLYGGRYFISSEQGPNGIRAYTVREVEADGGIETVGDFQQYETAAQARAAIKQLLKG
jgi:hypothetical protein